MTRCKFQCMAVTKRLQSVHNPESGKYEPGFVYDAQFNVVYDGSEENKRFFASTPTGQLTVGTIREGTFEPGKSYYLDITEAE